MKGFNYWIFPAIMSHEPDINKRVKSLIKRVCVKYSISKEQIKSTSRLRDIVEPRQISMYIMREIYDMSYQGIANEFDKNHATVISACNKISGVMSYDKEFKRKVKNLI